MKKYFPYLLVILLLVSATVWFVFNKTTGSVNEQEGDFSVKETELIAAIDLSDTENNHVLISLVNGVWMVNKKYPVRDELIKQLLEAVTRVTSLCPVPTAAHDNVMRDMLGQHTQVKILDAQGNLLKSYWVGGAAVDGQNTYMLLEIEGKPAARPHMTYVPGFRGYLSPRYSTSEENWRSRVLFNYKPEDIQSLSVNYPVDPGKSFSINRVGADSFTVSSINDKYKINAPYEQKYIRQYLAFYSSIFIEAFDNSNSQRDSIINTVPYCEIKINTTSGSQNVVKMFYMPVSKRSKMQFDAKGFEMTYDIDHYYASVNNGSDFAIVQYYVMGKLLRAYRDFYFKPGQ